MIESLVVLVVVLILLVAPVLSIVALVRVHKVERMLRRLSSLEGPVQATSPRAEPAAGAPPAAPPARPPALPPIPAQTGGLNLESIIAGRWLNRVGIVALLLAVAFFLKWAFDNDWVGPAGRVAIGLVLGASLLVYSQWLLGRGLRYFSEGIAGLGAGVLYLSLYAAWTFYQLVPQAVAFVGMIVVTGALVALALGRSSERLAFLSLVGGFLTPMLLSTGEDAQIVLFGYLAILNAGLLVLAGVREWRTLAPIALAWTVFYFAVWYREFYEAAKIVRTTVFASAFFLEFAARPVLRVRSGRRLLPEQIVVILVNLSWFLVALHVMLYADHRWALTVAVLALAAVHLVVVRLLPVAEPSAGEPHLGRLIFGGLALTLVTLAIPIRLEGEWITIAWAIEGAVLVWTGIRGGSRLLRGAGVFLFLLVVLSLLAQDIEALRALLNARFATFAVAVASYTAAFVLARRHARILSANEGNIFGALGVAANVLAVWALSLEVWDFADRVPFGVEPWLARQLGLSLLWTLCATALIVAGVRLASAALRWQGLILIGLVAGKVFLFDLSVLERAYRILSFFALGVVLLVVSFLYQRKLFGERKAGP